MKKHEIIEKTKDLKRTLGGKVFAFPIKEDDPFSKYAVVVYESGKYRVFGLVC